MSHIRRFLLLLVIAFVAALNVMAQSSMTDEQIMKYIKDQTEQGASRSEIVTKLMERGVTVEQIRRIRSNYEKEQSGEVPGAKNISGREKGTDRTRKANGDKREEPKGNKQRKVEEKDKKKMSQREKDKQRSMDEEELYDELELLVPEEEDEMEDEEKEDPTRQVFGRNIFNNKQLSFEPNMNIATPQDYRLGPGDAVFVDIWGASQQRIESTVSPDGTIDITNYGPVAVDGLTVAQANARLRSTVGARYGGSQIKLTVGQTRTITVDVMGEVKVPGTYTLSAFATVFNALYMAGGTNEIGTLRNIRIYRRGKLVSTCDIYDYILNGNMKGNVRLASGDVIIVEPYECLVQVTGKVKRPMFYEMKSKESVGTLIKYAGGFTGDAYRGSVRLVRRAGDMLSVHTVDEFERNNFQLCDGDSLAVDSVLNRYKNMVEAKGAVKRPGMYQMDGGITTVRQLIEGAGGLAEDAFSAHAMIHRMKEDRTLEVIQLDAAGIMNHSVADVALKNEDVLFVPSRQLTMGERTLTISGEVNYPGEYEFAEHTTLESFILQAGGLKDAASLVKVDVARRIRNKNASESTLKTAETYSFKLKEGFVVDGTPGFELEPFDEVYVRRSPGYVEQEHVTVKGEANFTGVYALTSKGMRLSDLVKAAGGLTKEAYALGAHLERRMTPEEKLKQQNMLKFALSGDSVDTKKLEIGDTRTMGINLEEAIKHPGSNEYDIVLQDNDVLIIPQFNNTVSINGEVMYPNTVAYTKGEKLSHYINQAGGFGQYAKKKRVYAVNMNGTVTRVKSAKDIQPGCNLIVPARKKRKGLSFAEILSLGTVMSSLGLIISTIIKN
ncbi:MAG: SLBB domain-containing protein [Alloprevotella sp.]